MIRRQYIKLFILVVITLLISKNIYSQSFEISLNKYNLVLPRSATEEVELYVKLNNIPNLSISIECDEDLFCYAPSKIEYSGKYSILISTYSHTYLGERKIVLRANYQNQYENITIRLYVTDYEIYSNIYWIDAYVGDLLEIPFCLYLRDEDIINVSLYSYCPLSFECKLDRSWSTKSTNFTLYIEIPEDKCCYQNLYDVCVRGISTGGAVRSRCFFVSLKLLKRDFNISIYPSSDFVYQGYSISTYVNVSITGPLTVNLSIENCPPSSVCQLNQTTFTKSGTALLTISTTTNTPPGIYYITVRAIDNRSITKRATLTLNVIEIPVPPTPPPIELDFNISIYPSYISIVRGDLKTVIVDVSITGPLTVNLSIENCPPSSVCQLNQTTFTKSGTALLTIQSNSSAGVYKVYLVGRAYNMEKRSELIIEVADFKITFPDIIDIKPGEEKIIWIIIKKYGYIEKIKLYFECPSTISCKFSDLYSTENETVYYLFVKLPKNISDGKYMIKFKLIVNDIERQYYLILNVYKPDIYQPSTLWVAGVGTIKRENITEIIKIQELPISGELILEKEKGYIDRVYPTTINLKEKELIEDKPEKISFAILLDILIITLLIIILVEVLLILKRNFFSE